MKKTNLRIQALAALLALPMVVTTVAVPGNAQALSIHATNDVNTKLVDIDHRDSVSDRKEDRDNKKEEKGERKAGNDQSTSSASTTTSTSTRILPPGITHADGIEKRVENGKGLPPGLVKIFDKFQNWSFDNWFNHGKDHGNNGTTTHSTSTTSTPTDQTALKFESFSISNIATSSAKVSVVSNFDSYLEVRYATSAALLDTPVSTTTSTTSMPGVISVSDNTISKNHAVTLSPLAPNTKYYVQVVLRDAAGHMVSKTKTFETLKVSSDIEAPKIFFNAIRSVNQTSATILWVTSERSDSQVWVSSSSTVDTALSPIVVSADLQYIHSLTVSNLQASTTYQYIVKSRDAAGNSVTASGSFTTDR